MQVIQDDWTPLFKDLKSRLSASSRKRLLGDIIGEIEFITKQAFGVNGVNRPKPWGDLSEKYSKRIMRNRPTLVMSFAERMMAGKKDSPHLINSFFKYSNDSEASLTNISPYADNHQFGETIPARPFYPITEDGMSLTPYAERKLMDIMERHFQS